MPGRPARIEQPVFIFNTFPQMTAFMAARGVSAPTSWAWAYGARDAFYFCLQNPQGKSVSTFRENYVRASVAHEYNHYLLSRAMSTIQIPRWFLEGIATEAGSQISNEDLNQNDNTVKRLFAVNALVPPQSLEQSASFNSGTEFGEALDRNHAGKIAPDPYQQSFSMTRYLLANMKDGGLIDFLNLVHDEKSFEKAFEDNFDMTLPQFYQSWYQTMRRQADQ